MSRITLTNIQSILSQLDWAVVSEQYTNLTTEMHFRCPKGHDVYLPWGKLRKNITCPVCSRDQSIANSIIALPKPKNITRILALDQATHITGYAIFDNNKLIARGSFTADQPSEVARINAVKQWLISMIRNITPDIIGIEGIQFQEESGGRKMGVLVFETLAHLQGVIQNLCYESNIKCEICPTNTWRHTCGVKGRTRADKKKSMQLLVKQWYGVDVSDDIADAIGIGYYLSKHITLFSEVNNWES